MPLKTKLKNNIMKNKYAQTREELLLSLINRTEPMAFERSTCTYDKDINGGCAIGCQVSLKTSKALGDESVMDILKMLPKRMQRMGGNFLEDVQLIHDSPENWINSDTAKKGKTGLVWSAKGIREINNIIHRYNLSINTLNKP